MKRLAKKVDSVFFKDMIHGKGAVKAKTEFLSMVVDIIPKILSKLYGNGPSLFRCKICKKSLIPSLLKYKF